MKRAARFFLILPIPVFALLVPLVPYGAFGETTNAAGVLAWLNQLRGQRGLSELATDPLLGQTAAAYAADLARRELLSHVDQWGRRALERFQASGGTTVLVGEILGSGAELASVIAAWEASPSHREVVLNPLWTHCGAAAAQSGSTAVWVVLFTSNRIYPLRIQRSADGYLIRGRFTSALAEQPILLSGVETIDPLHWDAASGEFSFSIPFDREEIYCRLGYRSQEGGLVVTNTFYPIRAVTSEAVTSDREKESR
jgi:uncharacterized protein YkwD